MRYVTKLQKIPQALAWEVVNLHAVTAPTRIVVMLPRVSYESDLHTDMTTDTEVGGIPLADTRIKMIGNKDVKYQLVGDKLYVRLLVQALKLHECLLRQQPGHIDQLKWIYVSRLSDVIVVMKILCCFVSTLSKSTETMCFLEILADATQPLTSVLQLMCDLLRGTHSKEVSACIQDILCDTLDLILNMTNLKHFTFDHLRLGAHIVHVVSEPSVPSAVTIRLLRLVPFMLNKGFGDCQWWTSMVISMLTRVFAMSHALIEAHWPQLTKNMEEMARLAFDQENFPCMSLNWHRNGSDVDFNLFRELSTRIAQSIELILKTGYLLDVRESLTEVELSSQLLHFYFVLLLLLKDGPDSKLRIIALNLIIHFLSQDIPCDNFSEYDGPHDGLKFFPVIVSMLDLDEDATAAAAADLVPLFLKSPTRILSELCHQHREILFKITSLKLHLKILTKLERMGPTCQFHKTVGALKNASQRGTILMDFETLLKVPNDDGPITDLLRLLGAYASDYEANRGRIIENKSLSSKVLVPKFALADFLFEILENFYFIRTQIILAHEALADADGSKIARCDWSWLQSSVRIMFRVVSSPLLCCALLLARVLLRSSASLRTFFVQCDEKVAFYASDGEHAGFVDTLIRLVGLNGSLSAAKEFWSSAFEDRIFYETGIFSDVLAPAIGVLGNLILDFSSFREQISNHPDFMPTLIALYGSTATSNAPDELVQVEMVRLYVMIIIANYMFNETTEAKNCFIDKFPIMQILERSSYGLDATTGLEPSHLDADDGMESLFRMKQKLKAFDILRNLTAGLPENYDRVVAAYDQYQKLAPHLPHHWHQYVVESLQNVALFSPDGGSFDDDRVMAKVILLSPYPRFVESINCIINHRYIVHNKIRPEHFPEPELLAVWRRLLKLQLTPEMLSEYSEPKMTSLQTNLNGIKVGIVSIINNLTWRYIPTLSEERADNPDDVLIDDAAEGTLLPEFEMLDVEVDNSDEPLPTSFERQELATRVNRDHDSLHSSTLGRSNEHARANPRDPNHVFGHPSHHTHNHNHARRILASEPDADHHESTQLACEADVQQRIDRLNELGFGQIIEDLARAYYDHLLTENRTIQRYVNRYDLSNSHDLVENLCTALRQLSGEVGHLLQRRFAQPMTGSWVALNFNDPDDADDFGRHEAIPIESRANESPNDSLLGWQPRSQHQSPLSDLFFQTARQDASLARMVAGMREEERVVEEDDEEEEEEEEEGLEDDDDSEDFMDRESERLARGEEEADQRRRFIQEAGTDWTSWRSRAM